MPHHRDLIRIEVVLDTVLAVVIDLHTHSNCSDGSDSPSKVVGAAASAGVQTLALTDHDTVAGLAEARTAASLSGINLITGLELSCHTPLFSIHLLGYMFDPTDPILLSRLDEQQHEREGRNQELEEVLNELGFDVSFERVKQIANGAVVGRPHFAAALVEKNYFGSINDAFAQLLGDGKPAYVPRHFLTADAAIEMIHDAGGLAVWAHPFRNGDVASIEPNLQWMADHQLDGVETYYSRFKPEQRKQVKAMARRFELVPTGGSDYHGTYKPDLLIGRGEGDLHIPDEIVDELQSRRARLFG